MNIITTIGPSSDSAEVIKKLSHSGANFFRINLSHSEVESLDKYFQLIKSVGLKPSLDTQGAQIRLLEIDGVKSLSCGDNVIFYNKDIPSDFTSTELKIPVNHAEVFSQIKIGNKLRIDFDGAVVQIVEINSDFNFAKAVVLSAGNIRSNRAIDIIDNPVRLNSLTDFDIYAIGQYANELDSIFLSFTNRSDDIILVKNLLKDNLSGKNQPKLIAKIESKMGIANIEEILPLVDGILIDRGDLSREISISYIPVATHSLINICHKFKKPCYIATNILDSMMTASLPSRAEVSDLYNLYSMGVGGIVLASEVAIGKNPVDSVRVVKHIYNIYKSAVNSTLAFLPTGKAMNVLPDHLAQWL